MFHSNTGRFPDEADVLKSQKFACSKWYKQKSLRGRRGLTRLGGGLPSSSDWDFQQASVETALGRAHSKPPGFPAFNSVRASLFWERVMAISLAKFDSRIFGFRKNGSAVRNCRQFPGADLRRRPKRMESNYEESMAAWPDQFGLLPTTILAALRLRLRFVPVWNPARGSTIFGICSTPP